MCGTSAGGTSRCDDTEEEEEEEADEEEDDVADAESAEGGEDFESEDSADLPSKEASTSLTSSSAGRGTLNPTECDRWCDRFLEGVPLSWNGVGDFPFPKNGPG